MALCVLCGSLQLACGRKGPPLAPIVYLPRPVADLAAKRVDDEVVVQFTVPALNTDGSGPADLSRMEVYAHTGRLPTTDDFLKYGTLLASIDIKDPAIAPPATAPDAAGTTAPAATPPAEAVPAAEGPAPKADAKLIEQGWLISVREPLTDAHRETGPMPPVRPLPPPPKDAPVVAIATLETPGTLNFDLPPFRFYTVVGVSDSRGRRGPYAGPLPVPLAEPPSPPDKIDTEYTESAITLSWTGRPEDVDVPVAAPAGAPATAQEAAAQPDAGVAALDPVDRETDGTIEFFSDVETAGTTDAAAAPPAAVAATTATAKPALPAPLPVARYGYNVYESAPSGTLSAESTPGPIGAPVLPLNSALLTTPVFTDPRVEFGVERCYVVRRVEIAIGIPIESAPTSPICVTPVDTFPPAAPKALAHISNANGVSLLWEANTEADLGGYVVLRGEAPGDKLSPLTPVPISETSYNDTTVRRGSTYVYEVVAVDRQTPPNRSAPSNRVEETVR